MNDKEALRDSVQLIEVPTGTTLFEEGDEGEIMYVIVEGEITLSLLGKTLGTASAGDIIGEMALINDASRSATATAMTHCLVDPIDHDRFLQMIQESPSFALLVMNVLANRLRSVNEQLATAGR